MDYILPVSQLRLRENLSEMIENIVVLGKRRLMRFHGVSSRLFPMYLKELEFRYNRRGKDLYEEILKALRVD